MAGEEHTAPRRARLAFRASDADREQAAARLREHYTAGRLTHDELAERLGAAYGARTIAELDELLADLPPLPGDPPEPFGSGGGSDAEVRAAARAIARRRVAHVAGQAAIVSAVCVALWLLTGAGAAFWPKWVAIGMTVRLALVAWLELGPIGGDPRVLEARQGRGGSRPPLPRRERPRGR